jgi:hypothetical protein
MRIMENSNSATALGLLIHQQPFYFYDFASFCAANLVNNAFSDNIGSVCGPLFSTPICTTHPVVRPIHISNSTSLLLGSHAAIRSIK